MPTVPTIALRLLTIFGAALSVFVVDVSVAHAQSASCQQLAASLSTLERNGDFRQSDNASRQLRQAQQDVQRKESSYVRNGCNDDAKAGRQLSTQCRALGREILKGREQVEQLSRGVETGNSVAQQREAILQEMARFGCSTRGRQSGFPQGGQRGTVFDQIFDALGGTFGEEGLRGEEFSPWGNYHTVRTLCVRKSDGFYWPISYSTLPDYVANDLDQCRQMCPGLDVDLYYYDNPGQEPEQMINLNGEAYTALPSAFKFRTEIDITATCKPVASYGSIQIADLGGGQSRAVIEFSGKTFPLPVRDPRAQGRVTQAALETVEYADVPMPRRRPARPGEDAPATVAPVVTQQIRVVEFNNREIRLVGPDTPTVPVAAAGR
ncbi:MAG TPA: DUF2865 domain-containing protein [Devosia sp.]|nr:DUF2865 domain-containing protein [Devosia sp.]